MNKFELKVEHQRKYVNFLDLNIAIENGIFLINSSTKEINFHFLLFARPTRLAIFHHQLSIVKYFQKFLGELGADLDYLTSFLVHLNYIQER